MPRPNFWIVETNTAPAYVITCVRTANGVSSAIDLTGSTVELILVQKSTGDVTNTGHQSASIVTAGSGIISYTAQAADFPTKGTYKADIKVTYGSGGIERLYDQAIWKVRNKVENGG